MELNHGAINKHSKRIQEIYTHEIDIIVSGT